MSIASLVQAMLSSSEALLNGGIAVITGLVIGYLLGSLNCAHLVSKLWNRDSSMVGDGNRGAFSVFRRIGLLAGIAVVIGDIARGALAIVLTRMVTGCEVAVLATGLAVLIGHIWPVFLRFRGGVGLGVILGVFLALFPMQWLCTAPVGITVLVITRNGVYFAVTSFVIGGLLGFHFHEFRYDPVMIAYFVTLSCLVGLMLWLKTRHLSPEMKRERLSLWISAKGKS